MFKYIFYSAAIAAILFMGCNSATTSPQVELKGTTSTNIADYALKGEVGKTFHYTITVQHTDTLGVKKTEPGFMEWKILAKGVNHPDFGVCDKVLQTLFIDDSKDRVDTAYFIHTANSLKMVESMGNFDGKVIYNEEKTLLSTPIEIGNSWTFTTVPINMTSRISSNNEYMTVPAGGFDVVHTETISTSPVDGDGIEKEEVHFYFSTGVVMCKYVNEITRSYPSGVKQTILYTMVLSEIK